MVVFYSAEQVFSNFRSKISAKSEAFSKILNPLSGDYTLYSTVVVSVPNKNRGGGKVKIIILNFCRPSRHSDTRFPFFVVLSHIK